MPLRRQHENSHIGCAQCKRRRVRCDEGRPICKRCIKYGGRCEYLAAPTQSGSVEKTPTSSLHSDTPESGGIQGPSSSVVSLSIQQPVQPTITKQPANENLPDTLELMHYYTASTYLTISDSLEFQPIWQHTVPREALAHDFLMHGILALAALHIAHVRPDQKDRYVSSALRHNDTALVSFRVALQQVTKENCDALFGFSTILLVLTLAFAQTHSHLKEHDPIEDLIQVFTLLQGTRSVLDSAMRWIATGPLGPLVRRGLAARNRNPSAVSASKGPAHPTEQALNRLENCSQRSIESPSSREVYSLAIQKLKGCAARAREHPGDRAAVIGWLVLLQTEYIASVKSREPVALAILGHYGVLLDTLKEEWFVMDLGTRIVEAVYERIPEEWRPSMDWAIQQVGSRPPGLEEIELA